MVSNALETLLHQPVVCADVQRHLRLSLRRLGQQVQQLEARLLTLVEDHYATELPLLLSIPGIGRKTAAVLLLFASGFTGLDNY